MKDSKNLRAVRGVRIAVGLAAALCTAGDGLADSITWTGGGASLAWDDINNWSDVGDPAGDDITFNNVGASGTVGTTTSLVDASVAVNTVSFINTPLTSTHTVAIDAGQTLTVNGVVSNNTFVVGNISADSVITNVTVKGSTPGVGSLVLNNTAGDLLVLQNSANNGNPVARSTLNLADLASFSATLNEVRLATVGHVVSELTLSATSNNLTLDTLFVGGGTTRGTSGTFVRLGAANTINSNLIVVAGGRMSASMTFQAGLAGTPTLTIRGKGAAATRANMAIGDQGGFLSGLGTGGSSQATGTVNWNGADVDAMLNQLVIGTAGGIASNTAGSGVGTLNFDRGTVDASTIVLGRLPNMTTAVTSNGSGTTGTINVGGTGHLKATTITLGLSLDSDAAGDDANPVVTGNLNVPGGTVTTTGNIVMGSHTAGTPSPTAANANVTITGGSVVVGGNIVEGAGNNVSSLTVNGGSLTVTGGSITADTVQLTAGSISPVTSITGAVTVGNSFDLSPGGAGATQTLAITGSADVDGTLVMDLGGATADLLTVSGLLDITAATVDFNQLSPLSSQTYVLATYGSLGGTEFAAVENLPPGLSLDYNYLGGNQIALVPEPGTAGVAMLVAGGLLASRRRRRESRG